MKRAVLTLIVIVLALVLFGLWVKVGYDDERERFYDDGKPTYYIFDGSKPLGEISLAVTQKESKEPIYTPQLRSQDYLTLALKTLPSDFMSDDLVLTDFSTNSSDCSNLEMITHASFNWSVTDKNVASQRKIIIISVDPTRGQISQRQQLVTGKYYPPRHTMPINPRMAEKVFSTAFDTFASTSEATTLLHDPNCYVLSHVNYHQPSVWMVDFKAPSLKRTIYYKVDTDSMQAREKRSLHQYDVAVTLLSLLVIALLVLVYVRLESRRLSRRKQD